MPRTNLGSSAETSTGSSCCCTKHCGQGVCGGRTASPTGPPCQVSRRGCVSTCRCIVVQCGQPGFSVSTTSLSQTPLADTNNPSLQHSQAGEVVEAKHRHDSPRHQQCCAAGAPRCGMAHRMRCTLCKHKMQTSVHLLQHQCCTQGRCVSCPPHAHLMPSCYSSQAKPSQANTPKSSMPTAQETMAQQPKQQATP